LAGATIAATETPTLFGSGIRRVKWGAAHAAGIDNGGDRRTEFAGGEGVEGAEAVGEFGGGQAALAVEPAEKILSEAVSFQRVALETTRDEVAVGIANCIPQWKPFARDIFALRGSHESIGERRAGASWRTYLLLSQRKFGILPVGNQNGGVKKQALL